MKALLDEQLSQQIAKVLRERGLDVEAVAERHDLREASDRDVIDVATHEQRAVITNDISDFRPIATVRLEDGNGHAGLIFLPASRRRGRNATGALADAIESLMRANPDGIPNSERWIPPPS